MEKTSLEEAFDELEHAQNIIGTYLKAERDLIMYFSDRGGTPEVISDNLYRSIEEVERIIDQQNVIRNNQKQAFHFEL